MKLSAFGRRTGVVLAVAATAVVSLTGTASASHSWGGYHWARTSNPLVLQLGNNVSSDWTPYLNKASADWSVSSVLDTSVVPGSSDRRCSPTPGMVEVCSAKYGRNGWLGLAQIWLDGDHITQGTTKMNDSYFNQAQYDNPSDRQHVMCQEVGHTFGLGHQDESGAALGTCMDYSHDPGSTMPNAHDYEELELIYGHVDATTTVAPAPAPGASGMDVNDRRAWGQLKEKHGDFAVYVRDFGNGKKLVTFVHETPA